MNDPENEVEWKIGDIVIHDADFKGPRMLMRIVGRSRKHPGLIRSVYLDRNISRSIYENEKKYLHDPRHYGIEIPKE